jgi:hypothetical protein
MTALMLVLALAATPSQAENDVTSAEKQAFLELLVKLPTRGEFYTDEAIQKAHPHTRVLLALTEKDLERHDIYPFLALSRGLLDHREQREYGVKHFDKIAHPKLKLFWAAVLFDKKPASAEIVRFLRASLESKQQAEVLSRMLGGKFEDFKSRVKEHAAEGARRDTMPPLLSLYLPVPLGVPGVEQQSTGVFIPANYRAVKTIDLVVFLRGYDIKRPKTATSVSEYWNSPQHPILKSFQFREEINKSGKNVILAVPTLGPFAESGKLKEDGGIQEFLDRLLDGLWRSGPHSGLRERPTVRNLILAAHSGGGVPLRRLAQVLGDDDIYKHKLTECWGFDSIYGVKVKDAEFWSDWAERHPGTKVSMFYIFTEKDVGKDPKLPVSDRNPPDHREPSGTTLPAMELERLAKARKLGNVVVVRESKATTLNHNEVPRAHLAELLKAAPYLDDR